LKKPPIVSGCLVKPAWRILPSASTMSNSIANMNSRKRQFTSDPRSGWASPYFVAISFQFGASSGMKDRPELRRPALLEEIRGEEQGGRVVGRSQSPTGLLRVAQVYGDGLVDAGDGAAGPRDPDHAPPSELGELRRDGPADDPRRPDHDCRRLRRFARHDS